MDSATRVQPSSSLTSIRLQVGGRDGKTAMVEEARDLIDGLTGVPSQLGGGMAQDVYADGGKPAAAR